MMAASAQRDSVLSASWQQGWSRCGRVLPRGVGRTTAPAPLRRSGTTAVGRRPLGRVVRHGSHRPWGATASSCPTRSPRPSRPRALSSSSTAACSTSKTPCRGTGPAARPGNRASAALPPGRSRRPVGAGPPELLLDWEGLCAGWLVRIRSGTAVRPSARARCSTATSSASWSGGSTDGASASSCVMRSADRTRSTSPSASPTWSCARAVELTGVPSLVAGRL